MTNVRMTDAQSEALSRLTPEQLAVLIDLASHPRRVAVLLEMAENIMVGQRVWKWMAIAGATIGGLLAVIYYVTGILATWKGVK